MKKIIVLVFLLISNISNAGLYDWRYFEPAAGCVIAGGLGYLTESNSNDKMKTGAIYCAAAAAIVGVAYSHYDTKYGAEFSKRKDFLDNKIKRYEALENQNKMGGLKDPHFKTVQEVIPAVVGPNGEGTGKRVRAKLVPTDAVHDRIGGD